MADTTDILMSMIEENWNQVRHSEDQRATVTNLIIIVVSVINGILTQTGFTKKLAAHDFTSDNSWPLWYRCNCKNI